MDLSNLHRVNEVFDFTFFKIRAHGAFKELLFLTRNGDIE